MPLTLCSGEGGQQIQKLINLMIFFIIGGLRGKPLRRFNDCIALVNLGVDPLFLRGFQFISYLIYVRMLTLLRFDLHCIKSEPKGVNSILHMIGVNRLIGEEIKSEP